MGWVEKRRETSRLTGWSGPVFERRYTMIPVSNEEAAQVEVLKYVLGHGVKEGLVERIAQWPGIHSGRARLSGELLTGHWFSRTKEYAARRGEAFDPFGYATQETVVLSPLPCWEHLPSEEYRERVRGLMKEVEEEAAADRERKGIPVLGPEVASQKCTGCGQWALKGQKSRRGPTKTRESGDSHAWLPGASASKWGAGEFLMILPASHRAPIRFDERRWETEPWPRLRHRHLAKAAGNSDSLDLQPPRPPPTPPSSGKGMKRKGGRRSRQGYAARHFHNFFVTFWSAVLSEAGPASNTSHCFASGRGSSSRNLLEVL